MDKTTVSSPCLTLREAKERNALVRYILESGGTLEDTVCALVEEYAKLTNRLIKLEYIVPHKIKSPDGSISIWRCPEDLIPLINSVM